MTPDNPLFPIGNPKLKFNFSAEELGRRPGLSFMKGHHPSTEIIEKRTANSKTFPTGNPDEYKFIAGMGPVHYQDKEGKWQDIDLTILKDVDGNLFVEKAPYKIQIYTDKVGYKVTHSDGTWFTIELVQVGDKSVDNSLIKVKQDIQQVFWDNLAPDISFKVLLLAVKPEIFTQISAPSAPKSFTWRINHHGRFEFKSFGGDMNQDTLEILVDKKIINETSFIYIETWTGRVSRKADKKTRIKKWFNDPVYPVIIDPTTVPLLPSDSVITGVYGPSATARYTFSKTTAIVLHNGFGQYLNNGMRFQNVGIPSGATITQAKLKLFMHIAYNATALKAKVWGDNVGQALPWSQSSRPNQINKTSASTSFIAAKSQGTTYVNVKSQVASIVGLGSWASHHAMRFAVTATHTNPLATGFSAIEEWYAVSKGNPNHVPQLIIVYSGGLGGGSSPRLGDMNFMGI